MRCRPLHRRPRVGFDLEAKPRGEPDRPQRTQPVLGEARIGVTDRADEPAPQVPDPIERVFEPLPIY